MEIKRKLDTSDATYDISGLNREQFSRLVAGYRYYYVYTHHSQPEEDELAKKFDKMIESDTLIV